jgi:hypothetical protein
MKAKYFNQLRNSIARSRNLSRAQFADVKENIALNLWLRLDCLALLGAFLCERAGFALRSIVIGVTTACLASPY